MPSVQILNPSAGEKLYVGTTYNIRWTSSNVTNQRIQYSVDGGINFSPIQTGLGPNVQQFAWSIPTGIVPDGQPSIAALVRIVVRDANGVEVTSGSNVRISNTEILSISPNRGPQTGNTIVNITGNGFAPGCNVKFGLVDGLNIQVVSATQIQVTTPGGSPGAVDVKVKNLNVPGATLISGFTYDPPPSPTVTNITPTTGPITGNTSITISGSNFDSQVNVKFGNIDGISTQVNTAGTSITTKTPAVSAAGPVDIKIKNPLVPGITIANGFNYTPPPPPTVSNISPTSGPLAGNTTVTITGNNFDPQVNVKFGDIDSIGTQVNSNGTVLTTKSPAATAAGAVAVKIKNPSVPGITLANAFTYNPPPSPAVNMISPTSGPIAGNTTVTISGSNFDPQVNVKFGNIDGIGTQVNSTGTSITTKTPAAATAGSVDIKIKNPLVTGITIGAGFNYTAPAPPPTPTVTNVTPTSGPIAGNTTVSISGTNFDPQVNVKFGNLDGVGTQVNSSGTLITTKTPAVASAGAVDIKIKNPLVAAVTITGGFNFTAAPPPPPPVPVITNISPTSGPVSGNTLVTISGSNFDPLVNVKFGTFDGIDTQVNASRTVVTTLTPAGLNAGAVDIKVKNPNVAAITIATGFTYTSAPPLPPPAPIVSNISPAVGPITGNTTVIISGSNFDPQVNVKFGAVDGIGTQVNSSGTTITTQTPMVSAGGAVDVKIKNPGVTAVTIAAGFTFNGPPVITGIMPPEGPREGGITVKALGMNFQPGATVRFGNSAVSGTPVVNAEGTSITCLLPAGEKGLAAVTVQNPAPDLQTGRLEAAFNYLGAKQQMAARLFSVAPKTVLLNTDTKMTVKGRNLAAAITEGTFAVRGPNDSFATIEMHNVSVSSNSSTQEDTVTFFLKFKRPAGLSPTQRVPYYVVASVRPKSRNDRVFEASRKGQFTLITDNAPAAFGVTGQLIDGTANMILLSGRNLSGASFTVADSSGQQLPVSFVESRDNLLIAGLTLDGGATQASLTLLDSNGVAVGSPIPLDVMAGTGNEENNDVPVGRLRPVPGQQVVTMPASSVGLFAFAAGGGDGGSWLPGDPLFPLGDFGYAPELVTINEFFIDLVVESVVVPTFGRTNKARIGVFRKIRAVPLVIHLEVTLIVTVKVFAFRQGDPFGTSSIGGFNEFPDQIGDAFGTYLAFVSVSVAIDVRYLIAQGLPDDRLVVLLVSNIDYQLTQGDKRLIVSNTFSLGVHIDSIRPITSTNALLLAAPKSDATPISDAASFLGFFFPVERGRACVDWNFRLQFLRTFLDGSPVDSGASVADEFVVRICTQVEDFNGQSLKLQIDPPSFLLQPGDSATARVVDMNNQPSPIPVRFELDAAAREVVTLGPQTSNSVVLLAASNRSGSGRLRALVSTPPGFALLPDPNLSFSFSATDGVSAEIDSAGLDVGIEPLTILISQPDELTAYYCDEPVPCKATARRGSTDFSNQLTWKTLTRTLLDPCKNNETKFGENKSVPFAMNTASPIYKQRPYDATLRQGFDIDIEAEVPNSNSNPGKVSIKCRNQNGKLLCRAWENRPREGALAKLVQIIAVEGLDTNPTERRQLGYAAANLWRYGRCYNYPFKDGSRRPTSLEDGFQFTLDMEKASAFSRFNRFDPTNENGGPENCTECVDYADAVKAAQEILADTRSDNEYAARYFENSIEKPAHAIAFDQAGVTNSQQPNAVAIFLRGSKFKTEPFNSCHTYRRAKLSAKFDKVTPVVKACGLLTFGYNSGGGTDHCARISIDGGNTFIDIGKPEPCKDFTTFQWRLPVDFIPPGKQVSAIVRIVVSNENDEAFDDRTIKLIGSPPLSVKVKTPVKGQEVNFGDQLNITWDSAGAQVQSVEISVNNKPFMSILPNFLGCDASSFNWRVGFIVPLDLTRVPVTVRVAVQDVTKVVAVSDVPITVLIPDIKKRPDAVEVTELPSADLKRGLS